ncbi:MAG: 4-hydroxy-tetrahydrodipicolinate reductase [Spirochaetales bacterium]|nr:MAG: 4-hydroxy-tetrahydrodipicolinate reductase [Spirochaetales bacterium]
MNVVLVGYGRMGREVEKVLAERGHKTVCRVDEKTPECRHEPNAAALTAELLREADGVIEFALAPGIPERIALYAQAGLPAVIGTTGWEEHAEAARLLYKESDGAALLRGSNFSVGAHLFFRMCAAAARLVNTLPEYDAALREHHHSRKADFPSGTALTAARAVLAEMDRKTAVVSSLPEGPIPPEALQVASLRVGAVPGVHELILDSPADFLTVKHEARGRGGFALGAVRGLEWLSSRHGWFEAETFMDHLFQEGEK